MFVMMNNHIRQHKEMMHMQFQKDLVNLKQLKEHKEYLQQMWLERFSKTNKSIIIVILIEGQNLKI
jgi:hypothetical protein